MQILYVISLIFKIFANLLLPTQKLLLNQACLD